MNFWEKLLKKITKFYVECFLPEIMMHRLKNGLCQTEVANEVNAFCSCQGVEEGRMIACANSSCKIEWFHYKCVGIKRAPKGDWYCPDCVKQ